jgi:hypothetical protein
MGNEIKPMDTEEERENVQRMNSYLGCRGTHRNSQGRLMPCSSEESLMRISNRAEPDKKARKRRRRNDEFEKFRQRGVRGIDTLPGGGLVSAPIVVKAENDSPRMKRRKARSDRQAATPAPAKDRIAGSSKNPKGTAASSSSASNIELTDVVELSLRNKVKQHNEKMRSAGKPEHTMASLRALKAVYRRGAGAFSVSHRPGKTRGQWAMARVNAFLYLLDKGSPRNSRYITDNDLLPSSHPRSTSKKKRAESISETKSLGRRLGRRLARVDFDINAEDRDGDGLVQEGTVHERIKKPSVKPAGKPRRSRRRSSNGLAAESLNNLGFSSRRGQTSGSNAPGLNVVEEDDLPKGRTSAGALKNRFDQIQKEVQDRFGQISTRSEAMAALQEAYPFASLDQLQLSDSLTNAETGGVMALLHLAMNYPKTAESLDSIGTQLDLGTSGRFAVRTGFSDDASTVAINNNIIFGRTFDDFISVVRNRMSKRKQENPNTLRWFILSDEIAAIDDLDDESKDKIIASSLVIHEFGHAWHERSTQQNGQAGEEIDPVDYVTFNTRTNPGEFDAYLKESLQKVVGRSGFPSPPNTDGMSESDRSKALAEYNKLRKRIISQGFKDALERFVKDKKVTLTEYRDDGLSKKEIKEMAESSTVSDYSSSNFAESIAESFTAEYLGMTNTKPLHYEKIWEHMNQIKTADQVTTEQLADGTVIETDQDDNIFIIDNVCGGLDQLDLS